MFRIALFSLTLLLSLLAINSPTLAASSELYLTPATLNLSGEKVVEVRVKAPSSINAIETSITYPADLASARVETEGSVLSIWINGFPKLGSGKIELAGGIPNPGFKGDGLVARVFLSPKSDGRGRVEFSEDSQILLNDGKGTNDFSRAQGSDLRVGSSYTTATSPSFLIQIVFAAVIILGLIVLVIIILRRRKVKDYNRFEGNEGN